MSSKLNSFEREYQSAWNQVKKQKDQHPAEYIAQKIMTCLQILVKGPKRTFMQRWFPFWSMLAYNRDTSRKDYLISLQALLKGWQSTPPINYDTQLFRMTTVIPNGLDSKGAFASLIKFLYRQLGRDNTPVSTDTKKALESVKIHDRTETTLGNSKYPKLCTALPARTLQKNQDTPPIIFTETGTASRRDILVLLIMQANLDENQLMRINRETQETQIHLIDPSVPDLTASTRAKSVKKKQTDDTSSIQPDPSTPDDEALLLLRRAGSTRRRTTTRTSSTSRRELGPPPPLPPLPKYNIIPPQEEDAEILSTAIPAASGSSDLAKSSGTPRESLAPSVLPQEKTSTLGLEELSGVALALASPTASRPTISVMPPQDEKTLDSVLSYTQRVSNQTIKPTYNTTLSETHLPNKGRSQTPTVILATLANIIADKKAKRKVKYDEFEKQVTYFLTEVKPVLDKLLEKEPKFQKNAIKYWGEICKLAQQYIDLIPSSEKKKAARQEQLDQMKSALELWAKKFFNAQQQAGEKRKTQSSIKSRSRSASFTSTCSTPVRASMLEASSRHKGRRDLSPEAFLLINQA